jgi:hypothetical protein
MSSWLLAYVSAKVRSQRLGIPDLFFALLALFCGQTALVSSGTFRFFFRRFFGTDAGTQSRFQRKTPAKGLPL